MNSQIIGLSILATLFSNTAYASNVMSPLAGGVLLFIITLTIGGAFIAPIVKSRNIRESETATLLGVTVYMLIGAVLGFMVSWVASIIFLSIYG